MKNSAFILLIVFFIFFIYSVINTVFISWYRYPEETIRVLIMENKDNYTVNYIMIIVSLLVCFNLLKYLKYEK